MMRGSNMTSGRLNGKFADCITAQRSNGWLSRMIRLMSEWSIERGDRAAMICSV